ncbi:MAG: helix-turn-helix transcriptional regulator [Gemmatimonadetes bacterium]|nr:helix-turn-helix transcriptional regulator [Gemmatimonadota bacterium]
MPARQKDDGGRNAVPISMGSPRFRTVEVPGFVVSDVWFPGGAVLPTHTHERAVVAICLTGRIDSRLGRHVLEGQPGVLWTEPAEDSHSNVTSVDGARVLAIQPDPKREHLLDPVRSLLESPQRLHDVRLPTLAVGLRRWLTKPDPWSTLNVQAGALELLGEAGRAFHRATRAGTPPPWLSRVVDLLSSRFRECITLEELAREAGVHPMHLTRVFRRFEGCSVGQAQRELRLAWAERMIRESEEPIGRIAIRAGFADQSHFTRVFRASRGTTPGALRRSDPGRRRD